MAPARPTGPAASPSPLLALVELLARRHALELLLLLAAGPQGFRVLTARTGAAPAAASQRLRELRSSGLVEVSEAGDYRLTVTGRRLQGQLDLFDDFARSWAALSPRARTPRGAVERAHDEA